jgi:hypothetical protein
MNPSYPHDPELHEPGSAAAQGRCTVHAADQSDPETCTGAAVVSFEDRQGTWQAGCSRALEELVERGDIEPLGQGA